MSYHILFEGVCFVLSYTTHIWNAYVAEIFLEIINAKNFILKCCHDLCAMWKIMHRVYLQYLYQYITKFKSVLFYQNNQTNFIYILKLYIAHMRCSRENAVIHRA